MKLKYKAMVLSCMDPRFQPIVYNYLKKKKLIGKYSAFTIAGSAIGVTASKFKKWHRTFWDNICLLYTSPSPRDVRSSRMPSSA